MRAVSLAPILFAVFASAASADTPQPPVKPLPVTALTIDTTFGHAKFKVEVASDWRSQEYGLMNRKYLAPDAGMLFDFRAPQMTVFWMKDTLIPLDMIFIRPDGTVSSVAPDAVPMSLTSIPSVEPVRAVLEIPGGRAAALGIYPGEKVHSPALKDIGAGH
jgi:uncharacterized membrane protein (UPF0127 family)